MRIENLLLQDFGRKSNLRLEDLSPRVNVVYGPNGSGKSTTIQFIRWMLFGNSDESSQRYLRKTTARAAGQLSVFHNGQLRSIARQDDGSRWGQLSVADGQRCSPQTDELLSLLGDVDQRDFDQLFAPNFEQELDVYGLLRNAQARGLALTGHHVTNPRVPEIRLRIDNLRRDMDRLPWRASDVHALIEQKRLLESRISMLEEESRRRRLDFDREYQEISRQVQQLEQEIAQIREQWHLKDNDVGARRSELEAAWRDAEEAKQAYLRRRREELASIEAHIGRARAMISEVRQRYERVDSDVRTQELDESARPSPDTTACLVGSITRQLDLLRQTPQTTYDAGLGRYRPASSALPPTEVTGGGHAPRVPDELGSKPVPTLDGLRSEVGRLCRTLQENQSGQRAQQLRTELEQLRQCDHVMETWIESLNQQRDQVATELDQVQLHGVALVADTAGGDVWNHRGSIAGEPAQPDRVKAVPHACDSYQPIQPESDVLLRRLTGERDGRNRELEAAERQLRQLLDRRRELETALGRLSDQQLAATRRELIETESLVRTAEERQRLQRDIEHLEAELQRMKGSFQPSTIIQRASETLRRLSINRLVALSVDGVGGVVVEDEAGRWLPFGQLSRGIRDQVYLSLALALVAAFRTRGVELPLILNDAFGHIDVDRDDAMAAVLNDFAAQGHQLLLFTPHRHVVQLFEPYPTRYFELSGAAPLATPRPPEDPLPIEGLVEAVRFRPRGEDLASLRSARMARRVQRAKSERDSDTSSRFVESDGLDGWESSAAVAPPEMPAADRSHDYSNVTLSNEESFAELPRSRRADARPFQPIVTSPAVVRNSVSSPRPPATPDRPASHALSRSTTLDAAGIIDADVTSRLRAMSIVTLDDFLKASPAAIDRELQSWGLSTRPIRRWQDELQLRCQIAGLSANEARLLVAAGVSDLQTLADCEADTLTSRLTMLLTSQGGNGAPLLHLDLAKVATWVTTARRRVAQYRNVAPTRWSSRGNSPTTYAESQPELDASQESQRRPSDFDQPTRRPLATEDENSARPDAFTRRDETELLGASSADDDVNDGGRDQRARRSSRSGQRTSRSSRSRSSRSEQTKRGRRSKTLKFYLDRSAPIVDAPSIGTRTAERLEKVGLRTVEDLLSIDPESAAASIGYRRITADTIQQWQAQAVLGCRIPMLRAHDAQILVAIGVTDPDDLASMSADELWGIVRPFISTTECKRIIRNGKTPDAKEIEDWIYWAKNSRALSVA